MSPYLLAARILTGMMILSGLILFIRCPTRRFQALLWLGVGAGMVLIVCQPGLWTRYTDAAQALKMRIAMGILSFMVLMTTMEAVRRTAMLERYALLWIFTGLVIFLVAIYPNAIAWLVAVTGMQYISALLTVVFAFLLLVTFDFSIALSRHQEKQKQLAQAVALLEKRVKEMENSKKE